MKNTGLTLNDAKNEAADDHAGTSSFNVMPRRRVLKTAGLAVGMSLMSDSLIAQAEERLIPPLDGKTPPDYNPSSEYLFTIFATIGETITVGETQQGIIRTIPITGGEVVGEKVKGRVVPGGADWQLSRFDDTTELVATYAIQLEDKTYIKVINKGLNAPGAGGERYFRTHIHFDAPNGPHDWLNKAIFLCKAGLHPERERTVFIEVFKLV